MALGEDLQKLLRKRYTPFSMIDLRYGQKDISFKTDANGNAIQLFIGKRNEAGKVIGDRYTRVLKTGKEGNIIKDHWDMKGKATD